VELIRHCATVLALACLVAALILPGTSPARPRDNWADKTLDGLSLRDKIAQLVQIRMAGKFVNRQSREFKKIEEQIRDNHIGGLVLFAGNVYESAMMLNDFQEMSVLPLLVSADFERGAAFRVADTTSFPWAMALGAAGDEELAYREGFATAQESRAMGVHWIFAPVVDVNNNPDNPVINVRAFGEDPDAVSRLGLAFMRGAQAGGVLTTAKHFPGHGDTATDSHVGLPVVQSDRSRLERYEFVPFRRLIDAGVDAVMTAHVAVPHLTRDDFLPATLSPDILTDVLKNSLGFRGIVVTDALEMGGITNRYGGGAAAVAAIKAGADVLLLPTDADEAIDAVERAVLSGEISEAQIDASARKILDAKKRLRLDERRTVDLDEIGNLVSAPENLALAQKIADRAVTVLKDEGRLLPLDPSDIRRVYGLVLTPALDSDSGTAFLGAFRERFPGARTEWGNARMPADQLAAIDREIEAADMVVIATVTRLVSGQSMAIPDSHRRIVQKLALSSKPVVWVCLGSPYLLRVAPEMKTMLCTFSHSENSQVAAAKALAGGLRIAGKTPVTIPGIAGIGAGLTIPARGTAPAPLPEPAQNTDGHL
jgi:beta-N-acetylhexosaminidase